jgi:hypothetical protein
MIRNQRSQGYKLDAKKLSDKFLLKEKKFKLFEHNDLEIIFILSLL